jgi:hypothetical protein
MTALEHWPEATAGDLQSISSAFRDHLRHEDDTTLSTAVETINHRPGLLARMFPGRVAQAQQQITVAQLRALAARRSAMLELVTEVELEIARKQGAALIQANAMGLQKQLADYAVQQIDGLTNNIRGNRKIFLDAFTQHEDDIETYRDHERTYLRAQQSLDHELNTYFDTLDELLSGFKKALETRLSRA